MNANDYKLVSIDDDISELNTGEEYTDFKLRDSEGDSIIAELDRRKKLEELEATKQLMPIGSVVTKDESVNKLMIIGHQYNNYDYLVCNYPNGVTGNNSIMGLNHNQIVKVYNIGYMDDNERNYRRKIIDSKTK